MPGTGVTVLDFGAFPGTTMTTVAVTGQTSIVAPSLPGTPGSRVEAWILAVASADHTDDEHLLEEIQVVAKDIVGGTGFTIYGFVRGYSPGLDSVDGQFRNVLAGGGMLHGQYNVQWAWA